MEAVYNRKLKAIELWVSGAMEKTHYSFGNLMIDHERIYSYEEMIFQHAYGDIIAFYDKSEMSNTTSQHIRLIQKILKELGINYVVDNENKYSHILYDDV
tara:strand:- start:471 stop:770 length:300 start_codon:yes stop_codon:yes gene_type:complete